MIHFPLHWYYKAMFGNVVKIMFLKSLNIYFCLKIIFLYFWIVLMSKIKFKKIIK
jgi:hypothetical protein